MAAHKFNQHSEHSNSLAHNAIPPNNFRKSEATVGGQARSEKLTSESCIDWWSTALNPAALRSLRAWQGLLEVASLRSCRLWMPVAIESEGTSRRATAIVNQLRDIKACRFPVLVPY